jgi:uncharacterized membrane protein YfcA
LAGFVQSVSGFGAALVAVPILAPVLGPGDAVVAVTLVSFVLSGGAALRERPHVDVALSRRMALAGLVGMPVGLLLLARASESLLQGLMAITVLAALVLVAARVRVPAGVATARITGVLSGVLLTSTGMNGPPLVLGLFAQRPDPRRFRGTLQAVLCAQDLAAIAGFVVVGLVDDQALVAAAIGLASCPAGWSLGDRVFDRIRAEVFHRVLTLGLAASALMLVVGQLH